MTGRCTRHELAVGPDGRCVVCRREDRVSGAPSISAPALPAEAQAIDGMKLLVGGAIVTVILVVGGGLVVRRGMPPAPARAYTSSTTNGTTNGASTDLERGGTDREAALRAAMKRVPVTVYTTSWCSVCKRTKAWLRTNDIPFTERDVEADPEAARARAALTSSRGVPTIDVDGFVMTGFSETNLARAIQDAAVKRL